jgi:hypothetical protein
MAAAGSQSGDAAFQVGYPLFEHIGGRVHDPGIDIAEFFQGKEVGGVLAIFEQVRGRLVQGNSPAAGGRVNGLSGVELAGGKTELVFLFVHGQLLEIMTVLTFIAWMKSCYLFDGYLSTFYNK